MEMLKGFSIGTGVIMILGLMSMLFLVGCGEESQLNPYEISIPINEDECLKSCKDMGYYCSLMTEDSICFCANEKFFYGCENVIESSLYPNKPSCVVGEVCI